MPTIADIFASAIAFHQKGEFQQAEALYRQILAQVPDHAESWRLLGLTASQRGEHGLATSCFIRAIEQEPSDPRAYFSFGDELRDQGKLAEAIVQYRRALEISPNFAAAHNNLGNLLKEQGSVDEACRSYQRALELKPNFAEAYNNLSVVLRDQGKLSESRTCVIRALELRPSYAEAYSNLGVVCKLEGDLTNAVAYFQQALNLNPNYADAHNNLGEVYQLQGKLDDAMTCFRRALERTLEERPTYAEARFNLASLMLLHGDFEHGLAELEWRRKCHDFVVRPAHYPYWDGSPMPAGTILLHPEAGLGDTLHFIRYAPLVKERAKNVVLQCAERLIPLLSRCSGIDQIVSSEFSIPRADAEIDLMSLPFAFKTTLSSIPNNVPYLFPDPELVAYWRSRLPIGDYRVGIAWQGNPRYRGDKTRSIPLSFLAPLAWISGVHLISLQQNYGTDQIASLNGAFPLIELDKNVDSAGTFVDTAAIMKSLDLVVTSDTAIAHLAGGLGIPVWIALQFSPDWRWLLRRSDSPWYPTMRLFRQKQPGDWASVFHEMASALNERALTEQSDG